MAKAREILTGPDVAELLRFRKPGVFEAEVGGKQYHVEFDGKSITSLRPLPQGKAEEDEEWRMRRIGDVEVEQRRA